MEMLKVLKQPVISEKSFASADAGKYVFVVDKKSTKTEIRNAIEKSFSVNVVSVNTLIISGKVKRFGKSFGKRSDFKKAIVTIKKGQTIEDFKGI